MIYNIINSNLFGNINDNYIIGPRNSQSSNGEDYERPEIKKYTGIKYIRRKISNADHWARKYDISLQSPLASVLKSKKLDSYVFPLIFIVTMTLLGKFFQFMRAADVISFIFSHIDENNWTREFKFTVDVTEREYKGKEYSYVIIWKGIGLY